MTTYKLIDENGKLIEFTNPLEAREYHIKQRRAQKDKTKAEPKPASPPTMPPLEVKKSLDILLLELTSLIVGRYQLKDFSAKIATIDKTRHLLIDIEENDEFAR
jgi:hypothetical protein